MKIENHHFVVIFSMIFAVIMVSSVVLVSSEAKNQKHSDTTPNIKIVNLEDGDCEFNPEAGDQVPFGWCPSLISHEFDGVAYHWSVFVIPDNDVNENSVITLNVVLPDEHYQFDGAFCTLMQHHITVSEGTGFFISCNPPAPTPTYAGFPAGTKLNYIVTNP